jgi:hypothetical protein
VGRGAIPELVAVAGRTGVTTVFAKDQPFEMEAFSEGKPFLKAGGVSKELAFWTDDGVDRKPEMRLCVGTTESANTRASAIAVKRIEAKGKWDPPFLKKE